MNIDLLIEIMNLIGGCGICRVRGNDRDREADGYFWRLCP